MIDGGSTDDTSRVLERYKSDLSYYVSEPDRGQSHAITKGFAHLKGDIIGYLNSDDLLMDGALRFVGEYFATHDRVDVIYGHRIVIDEDGREVGRWILPPMRVKLSGTLIMFLRKRCSGGSPFTKQSAELINRFSLPWIGTSCFDLSKLEHALLEYRISWRASVFTAKQKTQTLSEVSVSAKKPGSWRVSIPQVAT